MSIWSAVIFGGVSLLNGLFQGGQNRANRRFQLQENERNRQFAVDMWNRQNEYNLPTNQMSRLREAGINPHLAYSNGTPMNTSNAPASPTGIGSLPAGEAAQLNVGEIFNALMMKAQIKNIDADTEKKKAEKAQVENQTAGIGLDNQIKGIQLNYQDKIFASQLGLTEQQIKESESRISSALITDEKARQEIEKIKSDKKLTDQQVQNLKAGIVLINAQVQQALKDAELKEEQKKHTILLKGNVEAQTRLLSAQAGITETEQRYKARLLEQELKKAIEEVAKTKKEVQLLNTKILGTIIGGAVEYMSSGGNSMLQSSLP